MKQPQDYENKILLSIVGSSPAIITETLYALTQTTEPAYIPTEIHIITTTSGKQGISKTLLGENGQVAQLCHDYNIERPIFTDKNIHQISDIDGNLLADITTEANNEATASFIINKLREFTSNDDTSLHVSIAGGRKTMTFYMGYAMSVFGRIQDSMSHVLIDDSLTSSDFYYPTPQTTLLKTRNGKEFDAKNVEVKLGNLPYIRLRDGLTKDLLEDKNKSYSELIEIAQRQLAPVSITYQQGNIHCGNYPIKLADADISLYLWVLQRHIKQQIPISFKKEEQAQNTAEFLDIYAKQSNKSEHYYKLVEKTFSKAHMDNKYFGEHRSKINKAIETALGKPAAAPYLIESTGSRGAISYNLSDQLKTTNIKMLEPKERAWNSLSKTQHSSWGKNTS